MKKSRKTAWVLGVVVLLLLGVLPFRGGIFQHLHETWPLYNLFFQPKDFFQPLAQTPFSASVEGEVFECDFIAKYSGKHKITVAFGKSFQSFEWFREEFTSEVTISDLTGNIYFKKKVGPRFGSWWRAKDDCGLTLLVFRVPDDAPRERRLKARVKIIKKNESLKKKYGSLILEVRKGSDK